MPRLGGRLLRRMGLGAVAAGATYASYFAYVDHESEADWRKRLLTVAAAAEENAMNKRPSGPLPTRAELLTKLQTTPEFDVLVIGGGATGAGVALDAQSRGLNTAIVELDDYSSGTSSRSTKLIHGGVRYLQSAIMKADAEQYRMVKEALFERANLLEIAPHLSAPLPIMLPIYKWWQVPYFWFGIKAYDFVSGKRILKPSYYISKTKALELFPMLRKDALCGALIYYDGQHNDARMNLAIVLSAIRFGAAAANHCKVTSLTKSEDGKVTGAKCRDALTGKEFTIKAKTVVNATGPFSDSIRQMDNPDVRKICVASQGVHVVLPGYYCPANVGLLDPSTSDGRVIFFLPWEKGTVAGTTDSPCELTHNPQPGEQDVQFILGEIRNYLSKDITVRRGDVLSCWAGLRPLVMDPSKSDTASLARNHIIEVSPSGLVTIGGGKWTTYRSMAQETIDRAIEVGGLTPSRPCVTPGLLLEGAHEWDPLMYISLVQDYGLEEEVAHHLCNTYGDRAWSVAKLAKLTGKRWPIVGNRIHEEFPYITAEITYAIKEYAANVVDILGRRLRLAFLNTYAAEEALPIIADIMAAELGWSKKEKERQLALGKKFIDEEMGGTARMRAVEDAPITLTRAEMDSAKVRFKSLDSDNKGYITINDLRRFFKNRGEKIDERLLHDLLSEVDLNKNGQVDLMEFLQITSGLKGGQVTQSRMMRYLDGAKKEDDHKDIGLTKNYARSGGGV